MLRANLVDLGNGNTSAVCGRAAECERRRQDRPASATVVVSDLDELTRQLTTHGGRITVPETGSETGRFLYARHTDGAEIEYVEWTPDLVHRIIG
ncbi:hypothetical protein AB0M44_45420 [Streptosporangium subroseum]|uniref:VOC family protein n=1 Tax=Streptosporangium subroseum TaxID=106412 RepID=UPI0034272C36